MRVPGFPEVQSEKELADFVDTHDTAPNWDEMAPVPAGSLRIRRRTETAVRVVLSQHALDDLRALADQRGTPLDDLLQEWLMQRLQQERRAA